MVNLPFLRTTVAHPRLLYGKSFNFIQTIYDSVHNLVYFQCFVLYACVCSVCFHEIMLRNTSHERGPLLRKILDLRLRNLCLQNIRHEPLKPGVHTNDFVTIHGRPARIHTAPAESTVDSTYCLPQALCEYGRGDRESWRNC